MVSKNFVLEKSLGFGKFGLEKKVSISENLVSEKKSISVSKNLISGEKKFWFRKTWSRKRNNLNKGSHPLKKVQFF